jgi:hypothetical protein
VRGLFNGLRVSFHAAKSVPAEIYLSGGIMRIAYFSLDDVNRFAMQQWANRNNIDLDCPAGSDLFRPTDPAEKVILDLDYLPASIRSAWLARVRAGEVGSVFAHGHNIADAEAVSLRALGVSICQGRLRLDLLREWTKPFHCCDCLAQINNVPIAAHGCNGKTRIGSH